MPPCNPSFSNNIIYPIPYVLTGLLNESLGGKPAYHSFCCASPTEVQTEGNVNWSMRQGKYDLMKKICSYLGAEQDQG